MLSIFRNSNINFRKYDKKYLHIRLSAQALGSLSGGTEHNPDHLCTIKSQDILVDSKSSNSIHNEIHKVIAYNEYTEKINSKAFIFLDDTLPTKTINKIKKILNETPEIINRIVIFTEPSLYSLSHSEKCKEILENILQKSNFLIICNSEEKNFSKIQKELNDNIFILPI